MIQTKCVNLFTLHRPLRFTEWREVIKSFTLPEKKILGVNFIGWDADADLGIHFTPDAVPIHVSEFKAYLADIPKDIIDRHVTHAVTKRDSPPTEEERADLYNSIAEKLREETPHEIVTVTLVYFERGELWLCAQNKAGIDATLRSIRSILQRSDNDWDFLNHSINNGIAKHLIMSDSTALTIDHNVVFMDKKKPIRGFISKGTEYFDDQMQRYKIGRITVTLPEENRDALQLTLAMDGKIHKIEITETFKKQWKNAGDPRQANELWSVATGIWVNSFTGMYHVFKEIADNVGEEAAQYEFVNETEDSEELIES